MKKLFLLTAATALITSFAMAQHAGTATKQAAGPFEGTIEFIQSNGIDTSFYEYYVKGNNVKVDNFDPKTKNVEGTFILDIAAQKMTAVSPVRKIYFNQASGAQVKPAGTPKSTKTGAVKKINGYSCSEYLVVDADEGIKIHYWLASGHFDFFAGMLKILNRKDKFSEYYLQIPAIQGMFPMLAVQEDLTGTKKAEMKAEKLAKSTVSDDTFKVPAGYKEFQK